MDVSKKRGVMSVLNNESINTIQHKSSEGFNKGNIFNDAYNN
jgi:hypothetical protein